MAHGHKFKAFDHYKLLFNCFRSQNEFTVVQYNMSVTHKTRYRTIPWMSELADAEQNINFTNSFSWRQNKGQAIIQ